MGYIATNILSIPQGFKWYVFILDDGWEDDIRKELRINFENLSHEVGQDILVVKGYEKGYLYNSILENEVLKKTKIKFSSDKYPLPAILVSDTHFNELNGNDKKTKKAKIILFPIADRYIRPGSITNFLIELSRTLKDSNPMELENPHKWEWLIKYLELKPNFYGFGINLNKVIEDIFKIK